MIKDRVLEVIEVKRIGKENFFSQIGMTSANFRGNARNTPLNSTAIENIFTIVPDLNLDWLITGNGEMFRHDAKNVDANLLKYIEQKDVKIAELTERAVKAETLLEAERRERVSYCEPRYMKASDKKETYKP